MSKRVLYIAAYDVSDATRLRHALHVVKNYATGGQKSVYECFLTPGERKELLSRVTGVLEPEDDRFLLIRLESRSKVQTLGIAIEPGDPAFYYVG